MAPATSFWDLCRHLYSRTSAQVLHFCCMFVTMADLISLSSFTCHWSQIFICCVPLSHCHLKVKPFPYRNDRWCDPSFPLLFGLGWQKSDHGLLPVMCLAAKERREGIACPWQDRYTLMGHYTLHNLLKPSSELSKHIRVYIINSNFSWTLFVHSQPCMAEVKSFFYGKHCHYTPSCCREREREAGADRDT